MAVNPTLQPGFRHSFNIESKNEPELAEAVRSHDNSIVDLNQAIRSIASQVSSLKSSTASSLTASSSTPSSSSVTAAQATTIANTQAAAAIASTLGPVNNQTGTAYTIQSSDAYGYVSSNNAAAVTFTLNPNVAPQFFTAFENLGAGTLTLQPGTGVGGTGTINGAANLALTTGEGAFVFFDGKNWWAVPVGSSGGGGVSSLDGITGAITLVAGSGVTITDNTPAAGDITIAATGGGGGLPTNNPTFTGIITGPRYAATGSTPAALGLPDLGSSSASVTGNDTRGTVSATFGAGAAAGDIVSITFTSAFANPPIVIISPANAVAAALQAFAGTGSSAGFTIGTGIAGTSGQTAEFNYWVIE